MHEMWATKHFRFRSADLHLFTYLQSKALVAISLLIFWLIIASTCYAQSDMIKPISTPVQLGEFGANIIGVDTLINAKRARETFGVSGATFTVAVLDTGLYTSHSDFAGDGRVLPGRNFTSDNNGDAANVADGNGHGTNVAGIIVAHHTHAGVAPEARIIPLKVLTNNGGGNFQAVNDALQWVIDNRQKYHISVVSMSLGDSGNYADAGNSSITGNTNYSALRSKIQTLSSANVAVVVAAGNGYFESNSAPGMSFPAIVPEAISVGAVYDSEGRPYSYISGAKAESVAEDQITPFSQRLARSENPNCSTTIFAPGSRVTSSGIDGPVSSSTDDGTSQAAPVVAGVILLMQQYYVRLTRSNPATPDGVLPSIADLKDWLWRGGHEITDLPPPPFVDNVVHRGMKYRRVDALTALHAISDSVQASVTTLNVPPSQLPEVIQERSQNALQPQFMHSNIIQTSRAAAMAKLFHHMYPAEYQALLRLRRQVQWDLSITQTLGNTPASAGAHGKDGKILGEIYCAAVDLRTKGAMNGAQIISTLDYLGTQGFAAWYRSPGSDSWPLHVRDRSTGRLIKTSPHIHAVYVGCEVKPMLNAQVGAFLNGRTGLVGDRKYQFHKPTLQTLLTVRDLYRSTHQLAIEAILPFKQRGAKRGWPENEDASPDPHGEFTLPRLGP